jgi:hypothetical protein
MRKLLAVSVAALAAVGLVACSESPTDSYVPQFELVDEDLRVTNVNAEVYATFFVDVTEGGEAGNYILGSQKDADGAYIPEPANFPAKGKVLPGTCIAGNWHNSQGKPTAGSLEHPHPHCVEMREGNGATFRVVLEKISANYNDPGNNKILILGIDDTGDLGAKYVGNNQQGHGQIDAWGIKENTTDRVGQFTIDLTQFEDATQGTNPNPNPNLFDCSLSGDEDEDGCLNKEVKAVYRHGTDASGDPEDVWGMLYWFILD